MISCSIKKAEAHPEALSRDDAFFWSYVQPEARPSTLCELNDNDTDTDDDDDDDEEEGQEEDIESGNDMDE